MTLGPLLTPRHLGDLTSRRPFHVCAGEDRVESRLHRAVAEFLSFLPEAEVEKYQNTTSRDAQWRPSCQRPLVFLVHAGHGHCVLRMPCRDPDMLPRFGCGILRHRGDGTRGDGTPSIPPGNTWNAQFWFCLSLTAFPPRRPRFNHMQTQRSKGPSGNESTPGNHVVHAYAAQTPARLSPPAAACGSPPWMMTGTRADANTARPPLPRCRVGR